MTALTILRSIVVSPAIAGQHENVDGRDKRRRTHMN